METLKWKIVKEIITKKCILFRNYTMLKRFYVFILNIATYIHLTCFFQAVKQIWPPDIEIS